MVRLTRRLAASSQKDEKDECATAGEELSEEPRLVPLVAASVPEEEERELAVSTVSYKQVSLIKYLSPPCVHMCPLRMCRGRLHRKFEQTYLK